jgi:catechol 2,3-dioxygenase-like lactoylglutathione lyase family enzyme
LGVITSGAPILATADVPASIRFYTEVLGFASEWFWGEPPTFGGVSWGHARLMFNWQPELAERVEGHQLWFDVDDINTLHSLHLERGARIVSPIEDKPWGRREYTVQDPSGYHLRFGGHPSHISAGSGVSPEGLEIVRRKPTCEEHARVAGKEFYRDGFPEGVLERTWQGVIATVNGEVVGMLRIMYDAPGWFSVWDVAVVPEWQGRRIGTAMMEEALAAVREECPGAFVHLFTFKPEFYARLGFGEQTVTMRKV